MNLIELGADAAKKYIDDNRREKHERDHDHRRDTPHNLAVNRTKWILCQISCPRHVTSHS
jgi:hypothetical protein